MSDCLFELSNVIVERNRNRILEIPSLRVETAQHCCIFGPNGSGKSTFLKLLMRFFYPSAVSDAAGQVTILGREEWNVWDLRAHLGFVSSEIDHHFTTGRSGRLTPLEAVLTGFTSSELELPEEDVTDAMKSEASRWLDFFEIHLSSLHRVAWMSTGERRRVMLARAMVRNPQALLLDEPTAGLDLLARERLMRKIEAMTLDGIQIILVTHHLEEVIPQVQRVVCLCRGKLFFDGSPENAFSANNLSRLFEQPVCSERVQQRWSARLA